MKITTYTINHIQLMESSFCPLKANHKLKLMYTNICLQEDCIACTNIPKTLKFSDGDKLQDILTYLIDSQEL